MFEAEGGHLSAAVKTSVDERSGHLSITLIPDIIRFDQGVKTIAHDQFYFLTMFAESGPVGNRRFSRVSTIIPLTLSAQLNPRFLAEIYGLSNA